MDGCKCNTFQIYYSTRTLNLFTQFVMPYSLFQPKVTTMPRSRPIFKLALNLLLAEDVSLNPGLVVRHNIRLTTTNIRSIREKYASLTDIIISKTIYILAVTETWLRPHDTAACIVDISTRGYTFHHRPRPVGRGNGLGFLISELFNLNLHTSPHYISFESVCVNISNSCLCWFFICIFAPQVTQNFWKLLQSYTHNITLLAI